VRRDSGFRQNLERAGLVSENDGLVHAYLQARHGVWVSSDIRVDQGRTKYTAGQPCIVYPVPEALAETDGTPLSGLVDVGSTVVVMSLNPGDRCNVEVYNATGDILETKTVTAASIIGQTGNATVTLGNTASGIGKVATVTLSGYTGAAQYRLLKTDGTRIRSRENLAWELPRLEEGGWTLKQTDATQDALLNDFLALADALPLTAALLAGDRGSGRVTGSSVKVGQALAAAWRIPRGSPDPVFGEVACGFPPADAILDLLHQEHEKVADFARKWGPLWLNPTRSSDYWTLLPISTDDSRRGWLGEEPVVAFYFHAKQVKSALSVAASLAQGEPSAEEVRGDRRLGLSGRDLLKHQSRRLAGLVTSKLTDPEGVRLRLGWDVPDSPKLEFSTGFGFLGLAWAQVAQTIAAQRGLYTCDACGRPFVRSRRLASDRFKFCPLCSENGKGSKKLWYRRRRSPTQGN
jgi:hypothetical protein